MRRPRHKLQVSTFPFLAVLLGAMGSLIFLLLVMDRRAKIVARNKAREAHEAYEARAAALTAADRAQQDDWERQRRQVQEALAARDQELRGQLQTVTSELQQSSGRLEREADQQRQLQALVDAEQARLAKSREDLRQRQAVLLQSTQLNETSKAELARLTRDLLDLEQTLDSLKRLKNQQQPAYSLVPYHGQRGADRLPIYVECTSAGLMFLPDGARLTGGDNDIAPFRTEVEKRHGPLVKAQKRTDPFAPDPASLRPYVLFLIRPNGIGSFYRGQNALRGFEIDFGYELVDADWTLQVPTQPHRALVAQKPPEHSAPVSRSPTTSPNANASNAAGPEPRGPGMGSGVRGPEIHNRQAMGGTGAKGASVKNASQHPVRPDAVPGAIAKEKNASLRFEAVAKPGAGPAPAPPAAQAPLSFRPAQSKNTPRLLDGPAPGLPIPGQVANDAKPLDAKPLDAKPLDAKLAADGASAKRQASGGAPPPQLKFEEEPGGERSAMSRLAPPSVAPEKQAAARPASLGRVIGNRDFIITIACYSEGVVITPGGRSFVWNTKSQAAQTDEALVRAVSQLVTSRQATVRPGEPPYRAVLRFLVHEQGRRMYHRVYPLLENLRLPMVREDVEE